ncbi:hypothetical protein ACS0TY_007325 [Phlomoides rotata]
MNKGVKVDRSGFLFPTLGIFDFRRHLQFRRFVDDDEEDGGWLLGSKMIKTYYNYLYCGGDEDVGLHQKPSLFRWRIRNICEN